MGLMGLMGLFPLDAGKLSFLIRNVTVVLGWPKVTHEPIQTHSGQQRAAGGFQSGAELRG